MTVHTWQVSALLRTHEPQLFARRAGDRLLALASGLDARDTLELRLSSAGDGAVGITVSCRSDCPDLDALVRWVWEDVADVEPVSRASRLTVQRVTELVAAVRHPVPNVWAELEPDEAPAIHTELRNDVWPAPVLRSGVELLKALRATRAEVRLHLAPASEIAAQMAEHEARRSTLARDPGTFVALSRHTRLGAVAGGARRFAVAEAARRAAGSRHRAAPSGSRHRVPGHPRGVGG